MAISRKKRYDNPVKCSICKEVQAYHTVHGYRLHAGHSCCNSCFPGVRAEYEAMRKKESEYEMTEADHQTWGRL